MTEKNIFACKLFLLSNISVFNFFFFFFVKIAKPCWMVSKVRFCRRFNCPTQQKKGEVGHTISLTHHIWSIHKYKQGQYFSENFWKIWRTGAKFQVFFNLATCSNHSITDYIKFPVSHFLREN